MKIDTKPTSNFLKSTFSTAGLLLVTEQLLALCPGFRTHVDENSFVYIYWILGISFLWAISRKIYDKCNKHIYKKLNIPETSIEIKYGDLFQEKSHLVIGYSDCFDTEIGEVIKKRSVQGHFQERIYKNDILKLNNDIDEALIRKKLVSEHKPNKTLGKKQSYPIGTTLALGSPDKRYFLSAYSRMDDNCKAKSNETFLHLSLISLWDEIRVRGQGLPVSMPLIGSDLARTGIDRIHLIVLIILSFMINSKEEFITKKLTIILHSKDKHRINFEDLKFLMNNLTNV